MPIPMSLTEVTRRLVAELKPEQIILFGSHAWGRPTEHSDVDLLVIVPHSDRRPAQRATSAYRCLRDIPFPLDVLIRPPTLRSSKPAIAHSRQHPDGAIKPIIESWGSRGSGRSCIYMVAMPSTGRRQAPIAHSRFERTRPRPCVRHIAAPLGAASAWVAGTLGGRHRSTGTPEMGSRALGVGRWPKHAHFLDLDLQGRPKTRSLAHLCVVESSFQGSTRLSHAAGHHQLLQAIEFGCDSFGASPLGRWGNVRQGTPNGGSTRPTRMILNLAQG
ncbi:MAG: nucleotidyltransferase domain-containing protein [bacterium]|nr:nucleotidyltransferase domain-containing protein [bacterium]